MGLLSTIFVFLQGLFATNNALNVSNKKHVKFTKCKDDQSNNIDTEISLISETRSSSSSNNSRNQQHNYSYDEKRRCGK